MNKAEQIITAVSVEDAGGAELGAAIVKRAVERLHEAATCRAGHPRRSGAGKFEMRCIIMARDHAHAEMISQGAHEASLVAARIRRRKGDAVKSMSTGCEGSAD